MSITWSDTSEVMSSFNRWKIAINTTSFSSVNIRFERVVLLYTVECFDLSPVKYLFVTAKVFENRTSILLQQIPQRQFTRLSLKTNEYLALTGHSLKQRYYRLSTSLSRTISVSSGHKPFWNSIGIFSSQAFRWDNADKINSHSFRSNTSKIFSEKKKCLYGQFKKGSLKKKCASVM